MNFNASSQILASPVPILSVGEVTRHIRDLLQENETLQDVWVAGEVTNFSSPVSGHVYFSLKDDTALLRCVIWKPNAFRLKPLLGDGKAIQVHGSIRVYEQGGNYQLTVDDIRLTGEGVLYQEFIKLKALLEAEGLFDAANKKPIPSIPGRIGIVTSSTGAALQDMFNVLRRRFPVADVVLAPASVQGEHAPAEIVSALNALIQRERPDVILVARGGGSLEDLWAFNDAGVVRAIASSPIPVVTGVGHETDFTLSDFAADLRAPTPTAAAELVTPDIQELRKAFLESAERIQYAVQSRINMERISLDNQKKLLMKESPREKIQNLRQSLDFVSSSLLKAMGSVLSSSKNRWEQYRTRLMALDPRAVLRRGYALVTDQNDALIRSAELVAKGDMIHVRLAKGKLEAEVNHTSQEE